MVVSERPARFRLGDLALAATAALLAVVGAWVTARGAGEPALTGIGVALLVLGAAPLAWSRRWPMPASLATGFFTVLYGIAELPDPPFPVAPVVSLYVVARRCSRRTTSMAAVVVVVVTVFAIVAAGDSGPDDVYAQVLPAVVSLVLGDLARSRASAAHRAQQEEVADAIAAERARIARELHDIVAHHVSMIALQAEAAAATAPPGTDGAVEAFDAIADTSRQALAELRLLLDVLRDRSESAPTTPQPSLADLPALVERVRATGTSVVFVEEGPVAPVSSAVELTAYRIVQEGLTNVLRHASGASASVLVQWTPNSLELSVRNPAGRDDRVLPAGGVGRGLIGLRERVALVGGSIVTGRHPEGGFALAARLPLDPTSR